MIKRWRGVLSHPYATRLVLTNLAVRVSAGAVVLSLVLFLEDARGSFAAAGAVAGAYGIGTALGSPPIGRLIDRHGQTWTLIGSALLHGLALLLVVAVPTAPLAVLSALGAVAGAARPAVPACVRSLWIELLTDEADRRASYRLESVVLELGFILGPVFAGGLVAVLPAAWPVVSSALIAVVATLVFAATPPSRAWRGTGHAERGLTGPLRSPALLSLLTSRAALGVTIGAVQVGAAAAATAGGRSGVSGVLLGGFALGSLIGGTLLVVPRDALALTRSYLVFSLAMAAGLVPLLIPAQLWVLVALFAVAGLSMAPLNAAAYEITDLTAPPGTGTEARIWTSTATAGGTALGSAAAGPLVDAAVPRTAFLLALAGALLAAVIAVATRSLLRDRVAGTLVR
ncbi:MFS transporter [Streptomyces sp. LP05-1]|uniref:MFS transporter n=1 Tax=Streptomyces pyxinae TaxID=2970734 RepID=A0ABT2CQE1_9ACTN|nr:MFS transporter [Streptomyces sp. LP05-1]MCS0639657.1 MFS transporter [Streptomyces sp. LP05-1]